MKFAFANIFLAVSIDLLKSTEPLRLSLSCICCSNRSDAEPLSTGTDAIAIAIIVLYLILLYAVVEDSAMQSYNKNKHTCCL